MARRSSRGVSTTRSLEQYLRALELAGRRRQAEAAIESYSIGTIFDYQGRYGAALKSKEDALTAFRELKQRDVWLGEILSGYGNSLSLSGRMDEAAKSLNEAMTVARELKNPALIAQTSRFQADRLYYSGDLKGAHALAQEASQTAAQASDRSLTLLAQAQGTVIAADCSQRRPWPRDSRRSRRTRTRVGLKSLAVECALHRVEALLRLGNRAAARQEADRAIARAETFGLRLLLAKAHYLRAEVMHQANEPNARATTRQRCACSTSSRPTTAIRT